MSVPANVLEAVSDVGWWQKWFPRPDEWAAWHSFLCAVFALPMSPEQLAIYQTCTGRTTPPTTPAREVWAPTGRRGGKTRIAATIAAYLAIFVDWRPQLAPGERCTIMLISADRKQSRVAMRYLRSLFVDHPGLRKLIENESLESVTLKNRVVIEVTTASFRTTRGYSIGAVICDEIAFWRDENSANPAAEIVGALRPALMKNALLMAISSPYSRSGPLWDAHRKHFGKDGDPILVWQAPTRVMNPTVPQTTVDEAYELDAANAAAEYGGQFRTDVGALIDRTVVDAAVLNGCHEQPYREGVSYRIGADPAGGSGSDSFAWAAAHFEIGKRVLDAVREIRPPFSPAATIHELAEFAKSYHCTEVVADRWGGEFPRELLRAEGIEYRICEHTKSEWYLRLLPQLNSGQVVLLDNKRLIAQLCGLERRVARGGKDSVDHSPGSASHDDLINAAAIGLGLCDPEVESEAPSDWSGCTDLHVASGTAMYADRFSNRGGF